MGTSTYIKRGTIEKHDGEKWVQVTNLLAIKEGDRFRIRDGYDKWREKIAVNDGSLKPHPASKKGEMTPCVGELYEALNWRRE